MPLHRFPDWISRLETYLSSETNQEFRYGSFDCALFVCGAIESMTGVDPARMFRGLYSSRASGRKLLASCGGFAGVAKAHGMEEIPPGKAQRGDVLLMAKSTLGLMSLDGCRALVIGEDGVKAVPARFALGAWKV